MNSKELVRCPWLQTTSTFLETQFPLCRMKNYWHTHVPWWRGPWNSTFQSVWEKWKLCPLPVFWGVQQSHSQGREEGQLLAAPGMRSQKRNPEPSYHQHFTLSEHTLQGRGQPAMAPDLRPLDDPFSEPQPSVSDYSLRLVSHRTCLGSLKGYGYLIMLHKVLEKPAIAERAYIENKWQLT